MTNFKTETKVRQLWSTMNDSERREILIRAGFPDAESMVGPSLEMPNLTNQVIDRLCEYYEEVNYNPYSHKEY